MTWTGQHICLSGTVQKQESGLWTRSWTGHWALVRGPALFIHFLIPSPISTSTLSFLILPHSPPSTFCANKVGSEGHKKSKHGICFAMLGISGAPTMGGFSVRFSTHQLSLKMNTMGLLWVGQLQLNELGRYCWMSYYYILFLDMLKNTGLQGIPFQMITWLGCGPVKLLNCSLL